MPNQLLIRTRILTLIQIQIQIPIQPQHRVVCATAIPIVQLMALTPESASTESA
jgi:hypothetical protein